MKIALINQWYPPEDWGGVPVYIHALACGLRDCGHEVFVVTSTAQSGLVGTRRQEEGIVVIRLKREAWHWQAGRLPLVGKHMASLRQLSYAMRLGFTLRRILHDEKVDIVEYADVNAEGFWHKRLSKKIPYAVRLQTPLFAVEKFYTEHESGSFRIIGAMESRAIRNADILISPSMSMAEIIARACHVPIEQIVRMPNPLDPEYMTGERPPKQMDFPPDTILYLGRLEKRKGAYVFAEMIPNVLKKFPKANFVFAGPDRRSPTGGSTRTEIETFLLSSGIDLDRISFLGQIPRSQLKACYSEPTIVVIPTLYEDYPYAVIEAMACGTPVVASDCYGIPEIINHGQTGLLFKTEDSSDLAIQVLRLLENSALRADLALAGQAYIMQECNPRRIAEVSADNYMTLIRKYTTR